MNDQESGPKPEFQIEDAARIIGNLVIENDVLRRGLIALREEQQQLKDEIEKKLSSRPLGPTLAVVERAKESDASPPGEA